MRIIITPSLRYSSRSFVRRSFFRHLLNLNHKPLTILFNYDQSILPYITVTNKRLKLIPTGAKTNNFLLFQFKFFIFFFSLLFCLSCDGLVFPFLSLPYTKVINTDLNGYNMFEYKRAWA